MSPPKNIRPSSSDNITISNEATTIPTSPSLFVSKYFFDATIQEIFARSDGRSNKSDQIFEKQQEALDNRNIN